MNKKKEGQVTLNPLKTPNNESNLFHRTQTCTCTVEMGQSTLVLKDNSQLYLCMSHRSKELSKLMTVYLQRVMKLYYLLYTKEGFCPHFRGLNKALIDPRVYPVKFIFLL